MRVPGIHAGDVVAGISVGLVVIPQSIAYAQVAGMPPERGLYAAAIPSIAAAFFVSSRYLQTGPVGITALLTFGALSTRAIPGTSHYVALAALLALVVGVVRLLVGSLRLGALAYLLSRPLLTGFIPAAAILIVASQIPGVVGVSPPGRSTLRDLGWTLARVDRWSSVSIMLALATTVLIVGGRRVWRLFPTIVLAVLLGIVFSKATGYEGPVVGKVPSGLPPISLRFPWGSLGSLLVPGVVIALLGFVEPASIARTIAAQERERWNPNREFVSQGVANVAAAVSGAFPVGGSFSRTSLNRLAGARTRWSGAVAGLVTLGFLPFTGALHALPRTVLAAVVIASIAGLLRVTDLFALWRISRTQAAIATTTFIATLALAPHIEYAVLLGVGLSIANHLLREYTLDVEATAVDGTLVLKPRGVVWFGSAEGLEDRLIDLIAAHPDAQRLELDLSGVGRIDVSGAFVLKTIINDAELAGLEVSVLGIPTRARGYVGRVLGREL